MMENRPITLFLSPAGAEFIARFEGFRAEPYKCSAGFNTVGYGHRIREFEAFSHVTEAEALDLLMADATREAAPVCRVLTRQPTQYESDALISMAFNCGGNAIAKSALVREVNQGDLIAVGFQWERWNKAGGRESKGLTKRRMAELNLFMRGEYV
jgi:lysozyme